MPALGHLAPLEDAFGLVRGYKVQIAGICQDLAQLKALYKERWESFLANAGVVQGFTPNDLTTADWMSRRAGQTTLLRRKFERKPLARRRTQRKHELATGRARALSAAGTDGLRRRLRPALARGHGERRPAARNPSTRDDARSRDAAARAPRLARMPILLAAFPLPPAWPRSNAASRRARLRPAPRGSRARRRRCRADEARAAPLRSWPRRCC